MPALEGGFVSPTLAYDFANRDVNRIIGEVTRTIMRRAPFNDILDGGIFEAGISDTQRNVVMEKAVLNQSLALPVAFADTQLCGALGNAMDMGSTEFLTTLGAILGESQYLCIRTMYSAFQQSYTALQDSMQKQILFLQNADIRAQLFLLSGVKVKINSARPFSQMVSGDFNNISVPMNDAVPPDSALTFAYLKYLNDFAHEDLQCESFEGEEAATARTVGPISKFIGSQWIIDQMRNEINVRDDNRALTTGRYDVGEETLRGYSWAGPYRGLAFGIDQQPLRFNSFTFLGGQLIPNFIEPEISLQVTKGFGSRVNPAWRTALYEIGFLIFANSFQRLVPANYTGVGDYKYPEQFSQGELEFVVIRDNLANKRGEFGQFLWQLRRAYRPIRPHSVIPIAFMRCPPDFGLAPCSPYSTSTGAYLL
jgi:hypothetical protein